MNLYRLHLNSRSAFRTPLQGDTLFGHLCWGIRLHEGEDELKKFLKDEISSPSIAISNGFPDGFLPVPKLTPSMAPLKTREEITTLKKIKKRKYISSNWLLCKEAKPMSIELLMKINKEEPKIGSITVTRNVINRLSGTTEDNSLYQTDEMYPENFENWNIYISSSRKHNWILKRFQWAFENGYGADASTGKGLFEIKGIEKVDLSFNGNRYLVLGNFVPSKKDNMSEKNLYADTFTKYGKVGNLSMFDDTNPFKKPIVYFSEGATFNFTNQIYWCGSMLTGIHSNPNIMQNALVPVIPFTEEVPRL